MIIGVKLPAPIFTLLDGAVGTTMPFNHQKVTYSYIVMHLCMYVVCICMHVNIIMIVCVSV